MPSALVLNFFPAFSPPSSGGELRLLHLYRALSATYDVTMLTSTDFGARFEEIVHTPGFRELRFPKDEHWRNAYATLERAGLSGDLSGLAFALAVSDPACRLRRTARSLAGSADVVIHEFPFSEPVFADRSAPFEIYNAHNFETSLLSSVVRGPSFDDALAKLMRLEGNLAARAKLVFATSAADAEKFRLFYGVPAERLGLCPNGYDGAELEPVAAARGARPARSPAGPPARLRARPKLLFTGSAHHPNVEAARFLIELAPRLPQCDLILAGSVCKALPASGLPGNVVPRGPFDPAEKRRLLEEADLFLNPVTLGSGTSLKALEALGAGLPMVSTPEGVRGLDIVHDEHAAVVPRQDFARAVERLLAEPARRAALAASGLSLARATYTWTGIARGLGERIAAPPRKAAPARPLALALNDYPVTSATSGGMARVRNLLRNLDLDVVLVSFGPGCDFTLSAPGLLHVTVPRTAAHAAFEDAVNSGQAVSVNDGVASLFAGSNPVMTAVVSAIARRSSVAVFEHCFMAPLLDAIRAVRPDLPVVYSAHNVEATHKAALLRERRAGDLFAALIAEVEGRLVARACLVVCCTEADAAHFAASGVETIVVPNGCVVPESRLLARGEAAPEGGAAGRRVGFLGSSHTPNVEAADFILREIAPSFPDVAFELVGGICTAITAPVPPNVRLHGIVGDAAKTSILAAWDIALNPVRSGGGSSVKLPDFMAHGLATINTPAGARGFAVAEHDAGTVVEARQFRRSLARLLAGPDLLAAQRANARRYASERLSWKAVTGEYRARLHRMLAPPAQARRSLLVVTYRYTEPPLGGAEEYLIEVLKGLRPHFDRIDLAAVGVGALTNHRHFGCRFSTETAGPTHILGGLFDRANFFPPDAVPEERVMHLARNLERAWAREEREIQFRFIRQLGADGRLRFVSGFFDLENHGGVLRRWTAPDFALVVPAAALVLRLRGWVPRKKTLRLRLLRVGEDGAHTAVAEHTQTVDARFDVHVVLPPRGEEGPVLLDCTVDEHMAENDHRPFGVLLEGASVLLDEGAAPRGRRAGIRPLAEREMSLADENDRPLRATHFEQWIDTLHDLARRRDAATEAEFAELRGPHSAALQTWLATHGAEYDAVLVQGIPFDVIPGSVGTLRRLPKPPRIVTLPHFHGDDRFYYWRRYLESFADADATLLFSSSIADRIGPRERFAVVPGGGIRPDEHGDPTAVGRFREVHKAGAPFFLVLGRKTPSKGYVRVMEAHAALRAAGTQVDLVLIGPDEDGAAVQRDGVHYLGRQPRAVIRGALSECLGVVTMSTSESFGIVLCEAWLFGKPVIANRACYSFRELVRDGGNGLLAGTDRELQAAMARLAGDAAGRAAMGRAGFAEAVRRFTWPQVTESVLGALVGAAPDAGQGPAAVRRPAGRRPARKAVRAAAPVGA